MTSGTSDANVPQGSAAQELLEQAGACPALGQDANA